MRTRQQNESYALPESGEHHDPGKRLVNGRLAGVLYLAIITFGIFGELSFRSLVVPGDAAATAGNILNFEWLLRTVFATTLLYILGEVVLTVILYLLFRPVSRTISTVAAAFRLASLAIYGINLLNMLSALLIVRQADYLTTFGAGRPEALALFFLDRQQYGYAIGLAFFAVNCWAMSYLLIKSSHAPSVLGALIGVAGVCYLANSFLFFLVPAYSGSLTPIILAPAFIAETWFCLLLLWKGGGIRQWDDVTR